MRELDYYSKELFNLPMYSREVTLVEKGGTFNAAFAVEKVPFGEARKNLSFHLADLQQPEKLCGSAYI